MTDADRFLLTAATPPSIPKGTTYDCFLHALLPNALGNGSKIKRLTVQLKQRKIPEVAAKTGRRALVPHWITFERFLLAYAATGVLTLVCALSLVRIGGRDDGQGDYSRSSEKSGSLMDESNPM